MAIKKAPHENSHSAAHLQERRCCSSMFQHIWMNDQKPWSAIEAELDHDGSPVGTIHRVP
jgi:hypothetical protein